jgi:hypothetical protein
MASEIMPELLPLSIAAGRPKAPITAGETLAETPNRFFIKNEGCYFAFFMNRPYDRYVEPSRRT